MLSMRHGTLSLNLFVQASATAANVAPVIAAPRLLSALGVLLMGFGHGPLTPASSDMLARVTPPEKFALVFSVKQTGVPLGGAIAALLMPVMLETAGARWAMVQMAVLCALALALAHILRATLDGLRDVASPWPTLASAAQPLRFVLSHSLLGPLALSTLVLSVVQASLSSYLVTFLHSELGWGLIVAGLALSAAQVGGVVGRILWGIVADRTQAPRQMLLALTATIVLCGLAMPFVGVATPHGVLVALSVVYGATAIGWNRVFLATVAMATGGSLFFTYLDVVVGPPLFGVAGGWSGSLAFSFALLALPLAAVGWQLTRSRRAAVHSRCAFIFPCRTGDLLMQCRYLLQAGALVPLVAPLRSRARVENLPCQARHFLRRHIGTVRIAGSLRIGAPVPSDYRHQDSVGVNA